MTTIKKLSGLTLILLILTSNQLMAQQKRAQTSMKFLSTSLDARAAGMSDAVFSLEGQAESMFYNPAGMARMDGTVSVYASMTNFIADINYNAAAIAFKPKDGMFGVIGIDLMSIDYGDLQETIRANNDQGYEDLGFFGPNAMAAGVSYARAISNQFAIGGQVRYVYQNLADGVINIGDAGLEREEFSASTITYNFGVHYKTGWKSLQIGMGVRNFSQEITFDTDNQELPMTMRMGISMNILDLWDMDPDKNSLMISVDASRPRDYDEQIFMGAEYSFLNSFFLRGGYGFPYDEQGFSAGAGVKQSVGGLNVIINYSYTDFGVFSNVNRFALQFSF